MNMIAKPIQVNALENYSIWLKYSDNTEGKINLSHLLGKPIFNNWYNIDFFNKVHIDMETFAIAWDENIELCPNSLYLTLKGLSFEQWKSKNN